MKRVAVALALVSSVGLIALDAQKRIVTNDAGPLLKQLFPNAVAFSPHEGTPLHYKAYGADPRTNPAAKPIGFVFWTTDLSPDEYAYHGHIHMLVGMDMTGRSRVRPSASPVPRAPFATARARWRGRFSIPQR